ALEVVQLVEARGRVGGRRGHRWIPHSVLLSPAHRPARGSSPGATRRVHGRHPIEGEPSARSGFTGTLRRCACSSSSSKVHGATGLILTMPCLASHSTSCAFARSALSSRRTPVTHAS